MFPISKTAFVYRFGIAEVAQRAIWTKGYRHVAGYAVLGDVAAVAYFRYIGTGSGLVEFALAHKEADPTQHGEEHGQNRRAESYRIVGFVWG